MINKETFKWFVRGFVLTSLVLLAVAMLVRPMIGWAQGGDEENPNFNSQVVDDGPSQAPSTDDPQGRFSIPVEGSDEPISNLEAMMVVDANSSPPSTDDPQGRFSIPVEGNVEPISNLEAMMAVDANPSPPSTDDPQGRVSIPVEDSGEPISNDPAVGIASVEGQEIAAQAYSSPLIVPAAAFTSDGFDPDGFWFSFAGGYVDGWDTACMKAPAYLPHGATVTDVCYTVYDNNAGAFTVNLQRKDQFSAAASEEMAALTTSWDDANIHTVCDTTISNPDTSMTYAYYLTTCLLAADTRLYSVRIYYRTPVFLPIIMQNYQ